MGTYKYPKPVKLVIAILANKSQDLSQCLKHLKDKFGPYSEALSSIPFTWTNYYQDEVGELPNRVIISFENLIERESIVDIKRYTNELELDLIPGERQINLDPGYMTLGQFFLATTKDQRQRVYIRDGIFIDPTLYYKDKQFRWYDWTYYDYRSDEYHQALQLIRKEYQVQLKSLNLGDNN